MAIYSIRTDQEINWGAKGTERILQNIVNLLNTFKYEVAYDRVLGTNPDNVDLPNDKVIGGIISETYDLIEQYEPRATIIEVEVLWEGDKLVRKVVLIVE
ncbi:hypothetical protein [Clostridium cylindrosporum]|uniref:Putative lysozyme n=1 Tax=Clostridium cylindrosporum DSM 605 TaxID=1121307 RepID=A0A0J8DAG7_CLOCY|nr:hypothetical protein [Clostridium cylindrosporum]KMT23015.1 putative lysozyme [Clostridium cylindrosporum DSM 605]